VVNVTVKRRDQTRHVWIGETNESEPPRTHRNNSGDIKTGGAQHSQDQHGQALDDEIAWFDRQIAEHASHDPQAQRCMDVCGVGRLTASAAVATVVDARQFKNGRQMAAWLGIVPSQKSSGGKQRLGRITKQGDDYLRSLLFQGARSAILTAHPRHDRLSRWIVQLQARVGYYKTLVAVANKHARILWAVLAKGERFDPFYAPARTGGAAGA